MKDIFVRRRLALAIVAAWGAASLSGVEIVPDARKIEPLASPADHPAVLAAQRTVAEGAGLPGGPLPVFIRLSDDDPDLPEKIRNLGGDAAKVAPRIYAARIPRDATRYLSNWPGVVYIEAAKKVRPLLDVSRPATGADVVQAGGLGLPAAFDGTGSFVGIVDTGLSRNHRDFYVNGDLALSRVAQWFPDNATAGVDNDWHGTHVAGIAAGNGFSSAGLYTGMAPGARLLVVKSSFFTTEIPTEIDRILTAAGASPVAVNLSLGTVYGPHDGTSAFEQSVNSRAAGTAGSKRIVAVAAGNERTDREHFQAVLSPFGVATLSLAVPFTGIPYGSVVDIWADGADRYTVTASVPGGTTSVGSDQPPNGATHFQVFFTAAYSTNASITVTRTRNGGTGKIDAYVDRQVGQFAASQAVETGSTIEPANGDSVLAVGSFNTKLGSQSYGAVGGISTFSSLGPSRDGRLKPDLAAPGAFIYSAKSRDTFAGGVPPSTVPTNDNYVIMAGTSMATPHVAGIAALIWQSNPSLTGAQMRARLKKTAALPAGVSAPDTTWGYGKVGALQAASRTVASITAPASAAPGAPVALSAADSSGAYDPSTYGYALSYVWSLAQRPPGSGAILASTAASTSFTPDVPGYYTVALGVSQSAPAGVPTGSDTAVIRVNTPPTARITGPAGTDNATPLPATFSGSSSSDPDPGGQPLTFHWVVVSRPTGSHVTGLTPTGADNATLTPDVRGVYEIGLRADDGLDNSALAVFSFRSGPAPWSGGSGGCSVARAGLTGSGASAGTAVFLAVALLGTLALRRRLRVPRK